MLAGSGVLGLAVAEMLYTSFPGNLEGELSQRHTALVRNETCVEVAQLLELGPHLRLAPGERNAGGERNPSILGDACEAVMGAMFLDGGYEPARQMIEHHAPGIDDHRVAMGFAAVDMEAALRRSNHVGKVFDRARTDQRFPVRLAGGRAQGQRFLSGAFGSGSRH